MWNNPKMVVALAVTLILVVPGFIFDILLNIGKIGGEYCVDISDWFVSWAKD